VVTKRDPHIKSKKDRELDIVRMVYSLVDNPAKEGHDENPDFLLYCVLKKYVFGVEVTELYRNQASARLKNIPGYVDHLVEGGSHKHKDDEGELIPDEFEIFDEEGNLKARVKGVRQDLPQLQEFVELVENCISEKNNKFSHYSYEAKFHNLLIYDREAYFGGLKLEDFYSSFFQDTLYDTIQKSPFREIYLIGQIDNEFRYIPLKAYSLYAHAHQFDGFIKNNVQTSLDMNEMVELYVCLLSRAGLENALIHLGETYTIISYGDMSIRIDLVDHPARSVMLLNRDLDYSDGHKVATIPVRSSHTEYIERFRQYRAEHSFHSTFSFKVNTPA
jgi:hypothetical protein